MIYKLLPLFLLGLLSGCASTPDFDTTLVDLTLTPQSVIAESDSSHGKTILWGGTILDTRNLKESTRFEILAYPLDKSHRPLLDKKPLGRFIVQHDGYLEPSTYAPGRLLTALGKISTTQSGKVGESEYTYAVITYTRLHLWSLDSARNKTSFHFGVGIGL